MHLLWKRYSRSGMAPAWFYAALALGFVALAVWGAVQQNWIVVIVALVMAPIAIVGSRFIRRNAEPPVEPKEGQRG